MELTLKQVAEVFRVPETRIIQWTTTRGLPFELVADQYRFHRADVLEWAATNNHEFSPLIYSRVNGDLTSAGTHFTDALQVGGVINQIEGKDLRPILEQALDGLPLPNSMDSATLIELFVARECVGSSAIGRGIAVPHPRQPVVLSIPQAVVRLCYLQTPLELPTPDNVPVDKLFLMICPTAHEHLQLLARLAALVQTDEVRDALAKRLTGKPLFQILRDAGQRFHEEAEVRAGDAP